MILEMTVPPFSETRSCNELILCMLSTPEKVIEIRVNKCHSNTKIKATETHIIY